MFTNNAEDNDNGDEVATVILTMIFDDNDGNDDFIDNNYTFSDDNDNGNIFSVIVANKKRKMIRCAPAFSLLRPC